MKLMLIEAPRGAFEAEDQDIPELSAAEMYKKRQEDRKKFDAKIDRLKEFSSIFSLKKRKDKPT